MTGSSSPEFAALALLSLDEEQFGALVEPHRRELLAHCYRMMGTAQDAEDMVQEAFLRAWRRRETFEGRASFRAWLYRIATNACLDALKKRPRRGVPVTHQGSSSAADPIPPPVLEPIWLEPYPDHLLAVTDDPETQILTRESITLAFVVALHLLPPRQRAVLILRDVLDWRASEVADLLETSIPAVKSALHRARSTLADRESPPVTADALDEVAQAQLEEYVHAWEKADIGALLSLLKADATFSMPPIPSWYRGRESIRALVAKTVFSGDAGRRWRLLPTRANGQAAFGLYRLDEARQDYAAYGIQVLTHNSGLVADITTFRNPGLIAWFNLPSRLSAAPS